MFSAALTPNHTLWLDGFALGKAPCSYLRLGVGLHKLVTKHPKYGTQTLRIQINASKHTVVVRRRARIGMRIFGRYFEDSFVRTYRTGAAPKESIRPPGRYCVNRKECFFLTPGERLYIPPKGRPFLQASRAARWAARAFRKKPGHASLTVVSFPPGVLLLNGRVYTPTPVAKLSVPPGSYKLLVRNNYMRISWQGTIQLQANKHLRKVVFLHPKDGGNLLVTAASPARLFLNGRFLGWAPVWTLPLKAGSYHIEAHFPDGQTRAQTHKITRGQQKKVHFSP